MASPQSSRPVLGSKMEQSLFTLEIGPEGRVFHVHKEVLTCQSSVCCEALSEESHEALITLADVDAEAFEEVVMEWLYTGRLSVATDDILVKSYIFAMRYHFTDLRDRVVCEFYSKYMWTNRGKLPDYGTINLAFDNLPADAKLISFLLDLYGKRWNPSVNNEAVYDELAEMPKSFLIPLIVRLGHRNPDDVDEVEYLLEYLEQDDKRQADMRQAIVAIKIGSEEKVLSVHQDIIRKQSPYFKAALSKDWKEGQENAITPEDAELHIFKDIIMGWLYTGELSALETDDCDMVKAYVFADRFDIPELRRHILAFLHDFWNHGLPRHKQVIYVFDNLPESSKLCEMMVDFYGARWTTGADDEAEDKERQNLPVSFLLPLMKKLGAGFLRNNDIPDIGYYCDSGGSPKSKGGDR